LIYVAGSCFKPGTSDSRAGCGIQRGFSPNANLSFRLERVGRKQTGNRAVMRATIRALQFDDQNTTLTHSDLGYPSTSIVIASHLTLLVHGMADWVYKWEQNGWKKAKGGKTVENVDLWKCLNQRVKSLETSGVRVLFWDIEEKYNNAEKLAWAAA
ncbi:uncharacterized protein STEHIDRAFT_41936, partial [Stereum hirsutum FP-91666 SS1]